MLNEFEIRQEIAGSDRTNMVCYADLLVALVASGFTGLNSVAAMCALFSPRDFTGTSYNSQAYLVHPHGSIFWWYCIVQSCLGGFGESAADVPV